MHTWQSNQPYYYEPGKVLVYIICTTVIQASMLSTCLHVDERGDKFQIGEL